MSRTEDLVSSFREIEKQRGPDEESSQLLEIISELESSISDPGVRSLLMDVAADSSGYDMARIAALKALQFWKHENNEIQEVAEKLVSVLLTDEDMDVRNYAAMSLSNYTEAPGVVEAIEKTLQDENEDLNLRHNSLFCLERGGPTEEARVVLFNLRNSRSLGDSARRILAAWDE